MGRALVPGPLCRGGIDETGPSRSKSSAATLPSVRGPFPEKLRAKSETRSSLTPPGLVPNCSVSLRKALEVFARSPFGALDALYVDHFRLLIELTRHLYRLAFEGLGALGIVQLENLAG